MTTNRNYAATLRLPSTSFPMRALASGNAACREADLETLARATGSVRGAEEAYRTLRNCFRWMLGCLAHFDGTLPDDEAVPALERHAAHALAVRSALNARDSGARAANLVETVRDDLMAFYFDVRKDALYCDGRDSARRLAALVFTELAFGTLASMAREAAPNLVEEAGSHFEPRLPPGFRLPAPPPGWDEVRKVRKAVLATLEGERAARTFNSSLDLHLDLFVEDRDLGRALAASGWSPAETLRVSEARTHSGRPGGRGVQATGMEGVWLALRPADGKRCARSYRFSHDVGSDPEFPDLSRRDAAAVREAAVQPAG